MRSAGLRLRARLAGLAAALALPAAPLAAHDHWLQPSAFRTSAGERVDIGLRLGHPGASEEPVRDPRHVIRFESLPPLASAASARPIPGIDGRAPAGILRPREPGLHLLVFQSSHAFAEIEPEIYARFLAEEGLEDVALERERRGEADAPGRDSYARFDKALLLVGGAAGGGRDFERVAGLPLELVLETDPLAWKPGEELVLRLEHEGHVLTGRQVKLVALAPPHLVLLARTDAAGRVRFTPERGGPWVAFSVHQRRAAPGAEGDWEGSWASFAFELGEVRGTAGD